MLINKNTLTGLLNTLKIAFNKTFQAAETKYQKIAMKVQSNARSNTYEWLGELPKMRKWVGDKHVKNLKKEAYMLENDDFEVTVAVKRNDIEDGELGKYNLQAEIGGQSAAELPDDLVFELPALGFSTKCFDGQYFFDSDHEVAGQSVSNKSTKQLKCATVAEARASFGAAVTAMKSLKDDEGRSLKIKPTVLLVPPALEEVATTLATAEKFDDGKLNPYRGTVEVVVEAMESDVQWFLLDTSKAVKPFIYQERKAAAFVSQTDPDSDDVFNRGEYKFGAEARAAAGYGFWQLAHGSDGTTP